MNHSISIDVMSNVGCGDLSQLRCNHALLLVNGRRRPLLSILAIFARLIDLDHSSLHWLLVHSILLILIVELVQHLLLVLVLTHAPRQATLLSFQIE